MIFCNHDISKSITAMIFKLGQVIANNEYIIWLKLKKALFLFFLSY